MLPYGLETNVGIDGGLHQFGTTQDSLLPVDYEYSVRGHPVFPYFLKYGTSRMHSTSRMLLAVNAGGIKCEFLIFTVFRRFAPRIPVFFKIRSGCPYSYRPDLRNDDSQNATSDVKPLPGYSTQGLQLLPYTSGPLTSSHLRYKCVILVCVPLQ